jgi:replication initiation protein RepC
MGLARPLRSGLATESLEALERDLASLSSVAEALLADVVLTHKKTGNDGHSDRHQSNSNTQCYPELEPAIKKAGALAQDPVETKSGQFSLSMVTEACPDIEAYHPDPDGISTWADFIAAARTIRPMLGISPSAWDEAVRVLGEANAAVTVAAVLQRSEFSSEAQSRTGPDGKVTITVNGSPAIRSPGGYLRALTEKAGEGGFALGPLLMALIGQRLKVRRGKGQESPL